MLIHREPNKLCPNGWPVEWKIFSLPFLSRVNFSFQQNMGTNSYQVSNERRNNFFCAVSNVTRELSSMICSQALRVRLSPEDNTEHLNNMYRCWACKKHCSICACTGPALDVLRLVVNIEPSTKQNSIDFSNGKTSGWSFQNKVKETNTEIIWPASTAVNQSWN